MTDRPPHNLYPSSAGDIFCGCGDFEDLDTPDQVIAHLIDRERLAVAVRDGYTHPDRSLDDGFPMYDSAYGIADEIIAQLRNPAR